MDVATESLGQNPPLSSPYHFMFEKISDIAEIQDYAVIEFAKRYQEKLGIEKFEPLKSVVPVSIDVSHD